jgi:predicted RNase H-like nuclease (RuvC/YqgF family)
MFCQDFKQDCGFTQWLDKEFPEKTTEHMNNLSDNVDSLQQQVDILKCELEELRRIHQKRSRGEVVCPGDEKIRPSQICRLAKGN